MKKCLVCYMKLEQGEIDFHPSCSKKIFGDIMPPEAAFTESEIEKMALTSIKSQVTIAGAQSKISLSVTKNEEKHSFKKFTIVGILGEYILKPASDHYHQLPEVEDLTMHMAQIAGLSVVPHSLLRLASGNLAYITKRIDRSKKGKLYMEDMCQLTEAMTEQKYNGSYEQIAKTIMKYSVLPILDVMNFYEQVLFSFLTGNADMHLKNFSLISKPNVGYVLTPGYDMVSTALVHPSDKEDLALTINGRKKKIKRKDFESAFNIANLLPKQQSFLFSRFEAMPKEWHKMIDKSFLSKEYKVWYKEIVEERWKRVYG
jgi:serine/threonine-protein kinase HipA